MLLPSDANHGFISAALHVQLCELVNDCVLAAIEMRIDALFRN